MTDIVKALRNRATWETATGITEPHQHIDWMAAEEITRLREENARLRKALEPFAEKEYAYEGWADIARAEVWLNVRDIRAAAAAIREGGKNEN